MGKLLQVSILAERLVAQLLAYPPAREPVAVAERLLAIQAQDMRGARLAVRARSDRPSVADIDRALTEHRSLVVTWLNRGTLHLVRAEDHPWLQALGAPRLQAANAPRLAQEGVPSYTAARDDEKRQRIILGAGASPTIAFVATGVGAAAPSTILMSPVHSSAPATSRWQSSREQRRSQAGLPLVRHL